MKGLSHAMWIVVTTVVALAVAGMIILVVTDNVYTAKSYFLEIIGMSGDNALISICQARCENCCGTSSNESCVGSNYITVFPGGICTGDNANNCCDGKYPDYACTC